jgi:hypothetical protein
MPQASVVSSSTAVSRYPAPTPFTCTWKEGGSGAALGKRRGDHGGLVTSAIRTFSGKQLASNLEHSNERPLMDLLVLLIIALIILSVAGAAFVSPLVLVLLVVALLLFVGPYRGRRSRI